MTNENCIGIIIFTRSLTEKIVSVLPKMKCPYQIEPHQIQGLDCIHVFPVVQVINLRNFFNTSYYYNIIC